MLVLRTALLVFVLVVAFLVGVPIQWLLFKARYPIAVQLQCWFCRLLLAVLRIKVECSGTPETASARLLLANHVSWIDILALASVEPLSFLAKQEVSTWPLFGTFARVNATVFVERRRRRAILGANRGMAATLAQGRSVLLFPEGTTHDGERRGRFLTSHLACLTPVVSAGLPARVQSVAIAYSDRNAAWIGDATLLPHVWAVLRLNGLVCRLVYGPVEEVRPGFDRKALGRAVAQEVERLLASPARADPRVCADPHLAGVAVV